MSNKLKKQQDCIKLKPTEKDISRGVEGVSNISLRVRSNGTKEWRYRYTHPITNNRKHPTIGTLDDYSFDEVIDICEQLTTLLKKGITPETAIKTGLIKKNSPQSISGRSTGIKTPTTFSELASMWVEFKLAGDRKFAHSTIDYWWRNISYLSEYFGDTPPASLNRQMITNACKDKQTQNGKHVGKAMRGYCEEILDYAKSNGWISNNEAKETRGSLLSTGTPKHHPALTRKKEIGELLWTIEGLHKTRTNPDTVLAIKLLAHLFARSIDIRSMKWEDIDFEKAQWTFEPQKGQHNENMVASLITPLSTQVMQMLRTQYEQTGMLDYVFASRRNTKNKFISRNVLNSAIDRMGYSGKQSPHGFRATAKTVLMEEVGLRYSDQVTELQLGHKVKDTHGNAYNRVQLIDERTEMMQKYSDWLMSALNEHESSMDDQ